MSAGIVAQQRPLVDWRWIVDHRDEVATRLVEHLQLTGIAIAVGLAISLPLAVLAYRYRRLYPPLTWVTGILYTIPSLALFAVLIAFTGLSVLTAEIGLVSYTLLILIRNTVAGLSSVPADVKEAATAMGYTRGQLLRRIELPLALPVVMAGIRLATVTTIGLVTVTALIGMGGLGHFILQGIQRFFATAALLGAVLSVALAVVVDVALLLVQRALTPWARSARVRAFG